MIAEAARATISAATFAGVIALSVSACSDLAGASSTGATDSTSSSSGNPDSSGAPVGPTTSEGPSGSATGSGTSSGTTALPSTSAASTSAASEESSSTGADVGPYPIVLVHGFFGFEDFAGAGFVDYFWNVRDHLGAAGEDVFTPALDPFNSSTARGAQLLAHVEQVLTETGSTKVNLVGHSQGGLDARVVAHQRPDLVASVTTIATPHGGTPLADTILGLVPPGSSSEQIADALLQFFGGGLWGAIDMDSSVLESLRQFSEQGIADFKINYPDAPNVAYYSIAGRSDWHRGGDDCIAPAAPAFVTRWDAEIDPIDPLFALAEASIDGPILAPIPNDGLVRVRDAIHGEFWGCVPADHVDQIGQLFGDNPGLGNAFDHLQFYGDLVTHLRSLGH